MNEEDSFINSFSYVLNFLNGLKNLNGSNIFNHF